MQFENEKLEKIIKDLKRKNEALEKDIVELMLGKVCDQVSLHFEKEKSKAWNSIRKAGIDTLAMRNTKGVMKYQQKFKKNIEFIVFWKIHPFLLLVKTPP